jgi:hypothetical protein
VATGCRPLFMDLFESQSIELPPDIFSAGARPGGVRR